jgi:hypothetical protein
VEAPPSTVPMPWRNGPSFRGWACMRMNDIIKKNPRITMDDIESFQSKHNIKLPQQYIKFLLKYNGGYPALSAFKISGKGESLVNKFYGIGKMNMNLSEVFEIDEGELPEGFVAIASDPGGNEILLGIEGAHVDKVFFLFHDMEEGGDNNMVFLSNSFDEFFKRLF